MTLPDYEVKFIREHKTKEFWLIVRGITGQNYKKLKEIPECEKKEILCFLQIYA